MKTPFRFLFIMLGLLAGIHQVAAQGTAFTYQGHLNVSNAPANGNYDLQFALYNAPSSGGQVGSILTNANTAVSNGLFTVMLDFGSGVFTGAALYLDISVRASGASPSQPFTELTPRQPLTPAPYSIFAGEAANLSGTLPASQVSGTVGNNQLANNSITVNVGSGLSGGGAVALGGSTTLSNTGVLSVTGKSDITASTANGAVTLSTTATSSDLANTIVKRDSTGNFSAGSITLGGTLSMVNSLNTTAVGNNALAGNTTGLNNTASGFVALSANTTGNFNTADGAGALQVNTTGNNNTAIGYQALLANNGTDNTASGFQALYNNTTGIQNTANGANALYNNTTGLNNTASGFVALSANTTGNFNTADGAGALQVNTTGKNNTALGYQALLANNGTDNTAIGFQALYSNTTGELNTANGFFALAGNTTGVNNTASGNQALVNNTTGGGNAAYGPATLANNTIGSFNIALGYKAGLNITGNNNIDIGNSGQSSDNGVIRIGTIGTHSEIFIAGTIKNPICNNITIIGGSDLAEPFAISKGEQPVCEGAVVVIDEANPGQLKLTDQPYDIHVAGVVSGANGIHPGIQMHQEGILEGGKNVALSGRVYVQADTSNGPIKPGDLLTTSSIPGHAMKVTDHPRAQGAILGKAMTGLNEGQGMVLVLVTLQ